MGRYACHIVVQFPGGVLLTTTDHALLIADLLRACRVYSLKKGNPLEARVARYIRTRYASTRELAQSRAPAAFFQYISEFLEEMYLDVAVAPYHLGRLWA